ncbi:MAG: MFS transporter [Chloroflexi bacterium]|nr:MAG: MFS transporter [Chloroflexota bacterium]
MRRDYLLLLSARLVRAFGFGLGTVILGLHLERKGLAAAQIGAALAIGLGAGALSGLVAAPLSRRLGRRPVLALTGVLMLMTGVDLAFAHSPWLLLPAGLTGMLGGAGLDVGPFLAVEQPMLAEAVDARARNLAFGRYSLVGALGGALGGLAAGGAADLNRSSLLFIVFGLAGLVTAVLSLLLSRAVEVATPPTTRLDLRGLSGLAALFGLDALGGGFVANAVIAYWLHARFGAPSSVLGPSFAAIGLLQAAGYELSGRLASRVGLVNTMVFTHLPSNLLLLAIPLSPTLAWAIGLLLCRFAISQMDVPARQAYVVSIVAPAHRAGALATTGAVRGLGLVAGPFLAGLAIQAAQFGLPFYLGGGLKIAYDVALYVGFRSRRGEHEA